MARTVRRGVLLALTTLTLCGCPEIGIATVGGKTTYREGQTVTVHLTYRSSEPPVGSMQPIYAGARVVWTSNRSPKYLGTGIRLSTCVLRPGLHTITAQGSAKGKSITRSIKVRILPRLRAPKVLWPRNGASFGIGHRVTLRGTAPKGARLSWWSGTLHKRGVGPSLKLSTLYPGRHVFTLKAVDQYGATSKTTVAFTLTNKAPQVRITRAPKRVVAGETTRLLAAARDPDPISGPATLNSDRFRWLSDRQGYLGKGRSLPVRLVVPGRHVLTVSALDEFSARGEAKTQVVVVERPATPGPAATPPARPSSSGISGALGRP